MLPRVGDGRSMTDRARTGLWAIVGACAATVIAGTAIVTLTAAAQSALYEERREVESRLNALTTTVAGVAETQASLERKIDQLIAQKNYVTQDQLDDAMADLVKKILDELDKRSVPASSE